MFDKDLPDSIRKGQRLTTMTSGQTRFPIAPSKYKFAAARPVRHLGQRAVALHGPARRRHRARHARSGPRRSTTTRRSPTSAPATSCPGRPSLGSWLSYGLGTMNREPAGLRGDDGVVDRPQGGAGDLQPALGIGLSAEQAPGRRAPRPAATRCSSSSNPPGVDAATRRRMLDALDRLNHKEFDEFADPETQARIAQYEMAFRMQTSVPELTDISSEPKHVLDMYGPDVHTPGTFARQLPAGPPAGRARRALRADLPPRLGPARQPRRRPAPPVPRRRPGVLRPDHRPEAARAARRHAGRSGAASSAGRSTARAS